MNTFLAGVSPEHVAALVCGLLVPVLAVPGWHAVCLQSGLGTGWAIRVRDGWADADPVTRWSTWLLLESSAVHFGLPLGHRDSALLTAGFLVAGGLCAWLAVRAVHGRRWRTGTVALMVGMLVAYQIKVGTGGEEADQVGLATAVLELAAVALAAVPALTRPWSVKRLLVRPIANTFVVLLTFVMGMVVWIAFIAGHDDHGTAAAQEGGHSHDHGRFLARAQAGVLLRPAGPPATPEQRRAAADLATRTIAAAAKYRDVAAAEAAGYRTTGPRTGPQVHFENKANQRDGRVLDPTAPEQLVYAVDGTRAVLLGVVYQMPVAGEPGPAVGGPITRWHAHNICFGLLPPGFGVVSPFGTCPWLTVDVTIPEMMHVWVIDPPGGPFADSVDEAWVRSYLSGGAR